jgi:hypothetical protein
LSGLLISLAKCVRSSVIVQNPRRPHWWLPKYCRLPK